MGLSYKNAARVEKAKRQGVRTGNVTGLCRKFCKCS